MNAIVGAPVYEVLGPVGGSSMSVFARSLAGAKVNSYAAATVAGAAAGFVGWKKHRVLGLIGGAVLGTNLPAAVRGPAERRDALCNMALAGAGVLGSLYFKRHRVIGFVGGWAAAGAAIHFGGLR